MKIIKNLNDAVSYAARLGFARVITTVDDAHDLLCSVVDEMIESSQQEVVNYKFKPFVVKYNRKKDSFTARVIETS